MDGDGQYLAVLGQHGDSSIGFPVLLSANGTLLVNPTTTYEGPAGIGGRGS